MKDLEIRNSDFAAYLNQSKAHTDSWPAWKKDSIQAVGKNKTSASSSPDKKSK